MAGEIQIDGVTLATQSGGVASIDSSVDIKGPLNASGSAPIYACRAWVNFNGTGTVAIRASGNVSSITDNGTGDYTVNFTTAMPDANYCVNLACKEDETSNIAGSLFGYVQRFAQSSSAIRVSSRASVNGGSVDALQLYVSIFR